MSIFNSNTSYGLVSLVFHWLMAVILIGLFFLGLYMVGLDYYDDWYNRAPWWHEGFGLLAFFLLLLRVIWLLLNPKVEPIEGHRRWERLLSSLTRISFYLLISLTSISGYLISTAKGKGVELFNWFEIPALLQNIPEQTADLIGEAHLWLAWTLAFFVVLHVVGVLKHHFIDKDETFRRILSTKGR